MKQTHPSFDISLNLFTAVFERAGDIAVNLLNKDYTVLWANEVMAAQVQRPLDEMIGKPCYSAFRRRETPCPVCMLKIVSDTKQPCIMERWLDLPRTNLHNLPSITRSGDCIAAKYLLLSIKNKGATYDDF